MAQNEARPKVGNCRYLAAGKGISRFFSKIANDRFYFSRPPVSTAHPLLRVNCSAFDGLTHEFARFPAATACRQAVLAADAANICYIF
jgi:hypothetical protein